MKTALKQAKMMKGIHKTIVESESTGYITSMDTARLGFVSTMLGAGRQAASDRIDPIAGIELMAKVGDKIATGETMAVLYSHDRSRLSESAQQYRQAVAVGANKPRTKKLIVSMITDGQKT